MAPNKKKFWTVDASETTRYRVNLISALYKMTIRDVLERAVVCYANVLRIADKMEVEFPKEGIPTPERTGMPKKRRLNLTQFSEHQDFFKGRRKTLEGPEPEETTPEEPS